MTTKRTEWLLIVDTNEYAGNFEQEMGSFITGVPAFRGEELAELYRSDGCPIDEFDDSIFHDMLGRHHDSDGEHDANYVTICGTPGFFNNGHGGDFREGQEAEALEHHKKACIALSEYRGVHPADQERNRQEWLAEANKPLTKHEVYMSVAILFIERPTNEQLKLLKERALAFPNCWIKTNSYVKISHKKLKVTGVRFVRVETETTEIEEEI